MPLPSNYSTRTVHGEWLTFPSGAPAQGTVTFTPAIDFLVSPGNQVVIVARPITETLDTNGEITVDLPTTDDPDIDPSGFTYQVLETFQNDQQRQYNIHVPEGTGTLELATVTPVEASSPSEHHELPEGQ